MLSKVKIVLKTFGDHPSDTPPGVPVRAFLETFRWGGKSQPEYMQWHLVGWTKGENKTAFISPCILTVDAMWLTTSCPSAMPSLPWWTIPSNREPFLSSLPPFPFFPTISFCHSNRRSNSYNDRVHFPSWDDRFLLDDSWIHGPSLTKTLSCGTWLWLYFRL